MQATLPPTSSVELDAALLQAAITAALAALCAFLFSRYRKPYFAWWAVAWGLYFLRLVAITSFLVSSDWIWLYWHQVVTGWTALGLLYAALVFSQQTPWRWWYLTLVLFPPIWSYIAIYRLDHFLLAAGPAVLFLSLATLWTGWVFFRYRRKVPSSGATVLAVAFGLWGLHHLDYPFLRARGAWAPWGYYLDILLALAVGAGILLLVLDDLRRGLGALSALSEDLQRAGREQDVLDALLARPLTLAAVQGSALYMVGEDGARFVRGSGVCVAWDGTALPPSGAAALARVITTGRPQFTREWADTSPGGSAYAYAAVLPILREEGVIAALLLVGNARDPFTALDESFLLALGHQVGAALENADLYGRLETRTVELARLSARMIEQHEDERRRLSRELHDETAQVFSAVKMELGVLRGTVQPNQAARLDQVLNLIDTGIRSIRNVTNDLRPSLLDDLGLLPALRSLVADFSARSGIRTGLAAPSTLPPLSREAELALFRALQEALSNVLRHAGARTVDIGISINTEGVLLQVSDDGQGLPPGVTPGTLELQGHMGLAGMRERITALGGTVRLRRQAGAGALLEVVVPAPVDAGP
ncbi:MAG TPA: GAF domain-containing sensor histidine kinase [Gemmatimonadales bacterium]|nr:GAF domain-containing sensor histidine kinase [Gemmatimonadales bacterium]